MITWTSIGILAGFFAVLGTAFDRLLLTRQKKALHFKLIVWWNRLDETKIPHLTKLMATWSLSLIRKNIKGTIFSWQNLLISIGASFLLTSVAWTLGALIQGEYHIFATRLPFFTVYLSNFLFDLITIVVTVKILLFITKHNSLLGAMSILFDILIASILVIICYAFLMWSSDIALKYSLPGTGSIDTFNENNYSTNMKGVLTNDGFTDKAKITFTPEINLTNYLTESPKSFLAAISGELYSHNSLFYITVEEGSKKNIYPSSELLTTRIGALLAATTTFIPTFLYLAFLLIMMMAKAVLEVSKLITMHIIEVITQNDPIHNPKDFIPGTLLGILFGVITAFIKAMTELINIS